MFKNRFEKLRLMKLLFETGSFIICKSHNPIVNEIVADEYEEYKLYSKSNGLWNRAFVTVISHVEHPEKKHSYREYDDRVFSTEEVAEIVGGAFDENQ